LERVAEELGAEVPVRDVRALYLAAPSRILEVVRRTTRDATRVIVVGHNPGMETLLKRLTDETREFPTCALAIIRLDGDDWGAVERGRLERFIAE
jgi:phosphohistidine phosphatase